MKLSIPTIFLLAFVNGGVTLGVHYLADKAHTHYQAEAILVGQDCEGDSPVAVARQEDFMPRCRTIDTHTLEEAHK